MAETQKTTEGHARKVPEFLREPLEAAQERLGHFEEEAQRVLKDLMDRGRASRKDLEHMVQRLSKQDWTLPDMKQRIGWLREQGAERATEWKGRAETFRTEALDRMVDLQGRVIAFLGVATREQVDELSRELDRLTRRIEKGSAKARRGKKGAKPAEG